VFILHDVDPWYIAIGCCQQTDGETDNFLASGVGSTGAVGAGAPPQKMYYVINDHVVTL